MCALGALALLVTACSSNGPGHAASSPRASTRTTTVPAPVPAGPSAGCAATNAAPVKPGQERNDLTSAGHDRWYLQHVPPSYAPPKPMPVVIDLHGFQEGATIQTVASGLGAYGDTHGFITITPQGSGSARFATWDTTLGSADVTFIGDLIDNVERTLCVDANRVFMTGYSQGAFMTSTIACAYAGRVAAVATVAGIRDTPGCRPARPVPVVAFHGTADPDIAYGGGLGPAGLKLPAYDGSGRTMGEEGLQHRPPLDGGPIPTIATAWARRNGCGTTLSAHPVTRDVTLLSWPCPPEATVELYSVVGGGHTWPGSSFTKAAAAILGRTTTSISADQIIWEFFRAHPLRDS